MEPGRGIPDSTLTALYEGNGLFAKIIDAPAEEAVRAGLTIQGSISRESADFYTEALGDLDWEACFSAAIKWVRLYGGSLAVMLIDDGHGLESPLDWEHIRAVDGIRVYACPSVHPILRGGEPEYFNVANAGGSDPIVVHTSRCLVFRGDPAAERTETPRHEHWGISEARRIVQAVQRAEVTHHTAVWLLDRSVQALYKMRGLAGVVAAEGGEMAIVNRLEILDVARGLLGVAVIDAEGEDYQVHRAFLKDIDGILSAARCYLAAVTNIPYTILWGDGPPANSWARGDRVSTENWYNYVAGIQSRMMKGQLNYLLSILSHCCPGAVGGRPVVEFAPLWSTDEQELVEARLKRAQAQHTRALIVQKYWDVGAISTPQEIRQFVKKLKAK